MTPMAALMWVEIEFGGMKSFRMTRAGYVSWTARGAECDLLSLTLPSRSSLHGDVQGRPLERGACGPSPDGASRTLCTSYRRGRTHAYRDASTVSRGS